MSLRGSPQHPASNPGGNALRTRSNARTGCGGSLRTGTPMPCGAVLSYGEEDHTYAKTFVLSAKSMQALDPSGTQLVKLTLDNLTPGLIAVKSAMDEVAGRHMYGNVFGFQIGIHTHTIDHTRELESMTSRHLSHEVGTPLGDEFASVRNVLNKSYPEGFTFTTFKYTG